MRRKRGRIRTVYLRPRIVERDAECATSVRYQTAVPLMGEAWPAGGKVQAEQYGQRLAYIQNCRIIGNYAITADEAGNPQYIFDNFNIREKDGICLYAAPEEAPDYEIISIRPYRPLQMEVERRNGN